MIKRTAVPEHARITPLVGRNRLSRIAKIFVAILLVVVFEGAFRKWVSADFTNPMVLFRDLLALYGIFWAFQFGYPQLSKIGTQVLLIWTAGVVIWGLFQLIGNQSSPFVFLIGIRFWLLYLWFSYVAAVSFTEYDFLFVAKTIMVLLIAMAPLAVMQFLLPPGAFLNQQVGGDESTVFRVTADIVRTTGTFSFTAGYSTFLAMVTPFVLAVLTPGFQLWKKRWMRMVCLLALGIATIVSGSRTAIIFFGLSFSVFTLSSIVFSRGIRKVGALLLVVAVAMMLGGVFYSFSRAVDALQERFESAAQGEVLSERLSSMFFGESHTYSNVTFLGHGIGLGTNFAGSVATGERTFLLAETEVARTILEGGFLGFVFVGLKIFVIIFGLSRALSIARATGNSLPLLLWFTTGLALLSWSIIGQLTINALGYLVLGLATASLRLSRQRVR